MADSLPRRLIGYYGDDFTGSTDVMEALALSGLPTVLFTQPPTARDLAAFPQARAVGIAGQARAQSPAWMQEHLPPVYRALAQLDVPIVQYKVCSTFDSAPQVGSIGRALDLGRALLAPNRPVPIVVGATRLRRYVCFGQLYAAAGDEVLRIDRHPTMARHPVTPMQEADLRRHLALQSDARVASFDLLALAAADSDARFARCLAERPDAILFDTLDDASSAAVGRLIWNHLPRPMFSVSSSGLEYALIAHWRAARLLAEAEPMPPAEPVDRLIVVSGSCSPATAAQIHAALAEGFAGVELAPDRLLRTGTAAAALRTAQESAIAALQSGRSVVLHTALGPDDPRLAQFPSAARAAGMSVVDAQAAIGSALGALLARLLHASGLRRAVACGGDTSGAVTHALGVRALSMRTPLYPGSPLCTVHGGEHDGIELALKGGQVGGPDYLLAARRGRL